MTLALNMRVTESAHKDVVLHKVCRCESELEAVKDKVHELENVLPDLQREVKAAEERLRVLDNGIVDIQHLVLRAKQIQNASAYSISTGSFCHNSDVDDHTRLAMLDEPWLEFEFTDLTCSAAQCLSE